MSTSRPVVVNNDINETLQKLDAMVVEIFKYTTRPVSGRPPELLTPDKKRARELGMEMERYSASIKDGRIPDQDIITKINQQIEEANQLISKMQALEVAVHLQRPAVIRPTTAAPAAKQANVDKARIIMEYDAFIVELREIRQKAPNSSEATSARMAIKNLQSMARGINDNDERKQEQAFRSLEDGIASLRSVLNLGGSKPVFSRTPNIPEMNPKAAQNRAARLAEMQKNSNTATMPPPKNLFSNPPPSTRIQPANATANSPPPPPPVRTHLLADLMRNLREKEIQLASALPDQSKRAKNAPPLLLLPNQKEAMNVLKQISEISSRNIENLTANEQRDLLKRANELILNADAAIKTLPAKTATAPTTVNVQIHRAILTAKSADNEPRKPEKATLLKASYTLQENLNDRIALANAEGNNEIKASAEKALQELQIAHTNAEGGNTGPLAEKIDEINIRLDTERYQRAVAGLPSKRLSTGAEARQQQLSPTANTPEQNMPKKNDHFSKPPEPVSAAKQTQAEPVRYISDTNWVQSTTGSNLNKLSQEVAFLIGKLTAKQGFDAIALSKIVLAESPEQRQALVDSVLNKFPNKEEKPLLSKCFDWQKQIDGMIMEMKSQKNPAPEKINQLMQEMRTTFSENINKKNHSDQNRLMGRAIAGLNNIEGTKQPEKPKNMVEKIVDRVFNRKP